MPKFSLRASLRLWLRRRAWRRKRLIAARRHDDPSRVRKWERLLEESEQMVARRRAQLNPMREKAYRAARRDLGVREHGANNRGADVERIIREAGGTPGEPWCGDAVASWYLRAGSKSVTRAWAYVPTLEQILTRVWSPKRGHVVIYDFDGGVADHTGLFDEWIDRAAGWFWAIEGNTRAGTATSDAGGSEGVERRKRHVSQKQSFRRVLR